MLVHLLAGLDYYFYKLTSGYDRVYDMPHLTVEVRASIELSRRALELVSQDNLTLRGIVAYILGGAYSMSGDLAAANEYLSEAIMTNQRVGNAFAVLLVGRYNACAGKVPNFGPVRSEGDHDRSAAHHQALRAADAP